jgi:hypothetical protein
MLQSVSQKQREVERELNELNRLVRGLQEKIVLEQSHPEDHPVISPPKNTQLLIDGHLMSAIDENLPTVPDESQPSTPTKTYGVTTSSPQTGGSAGGQSVRSHDSTAVELGAPRTPGEPSGRPVHFLEMEHGSGSGSYGYDHQHQQYTHSPAHSCPMPTPNRAATFDHPFIDGSPAGLPRYRVNSDDDMYGMGWAGALGCGTTLFGERLIESSRYGTNSILNAPTNDILALSFDEHSLLDNSSARTRAAALAASAASANNNNNNTGSQDSPLRSGGSFDGVNFRTGMSGHSGLSYPKRDRQNNHTGMLHASSASAPRRQIRMMSEHRGVAAVRGGGQQPLKRRTTPDAIIGACHD